MYYEIEKVEDKIKNIPLVIVRPKIERPKASIIHYHGWSSNVENYYLLGEIYALYGYQAILPEIPDHGRRGNIDYSSYYKGPETILKTVEEYFLIEEDLKNKYNIKDLFLSGHSLGGMIASIIVNEDTRIKKFLMYNSIYNFNYIIKNISKDMENKISSVDPKIIEDIEKISSRVSLNRLNEIDSLFLTGELDQVIDPKFTKALEKHLLKLSNSKAKFIYYEDQGHGIGYKMVRDSLKFLGRRF